MSEQEQIGVKESKEFAFMLGYMLNTGYQIFKDGDFDSDDFMKVLGALPQIQPAIKDFKKIGAEFDDMSDDEQVEIVASFTSALPLSVEDMPEDRSENLRELVSGIFNWALDGAQQVDRLIEFIQNGNE